MKSCLYKLKTIFLSVFLLVSVLPGDSAPLFGATIPANPLDNSNFFPRAAAMGSAFVGLADDASALFSNPAGLGYLDHWQLLADSNFWLVDTRQEMFLLGIPGPAQWGNFALAVGYLDYGIFEGRDTAGSLAPNYSANRVNAKASWGIKLVEEISVGLGIQGSLTSLADSSYGAFAGDIGFLAIPFKGFRVGLSYDNLGFNSQSGSVEDAFNVGASYAFALGEGNRMTTALSGTMEPSGINYLQAGAEYGLGKLFFLRAGYQLPLSNNGIPGLTGLTAGLGLALSDFSFDYAYLPYGDLGASHRVSVGYNFGAGNSSSPDKALSSKESEVNPSQKVSSGDDQVSVTSSKTKKGLTLSRNPPGNSTVNLGASPTPGSQPQGKGSINAQSSVDRGGPQAGELPPVQPLGSVVPKPESEDLKSKDSLVVQFDLADDTTSEGAELEKQGKYQEALQNYRGAILKDPKDASAWWALGNLYRRFDKKEYAERCFEQVVKLQPENQKMADWLKKYKSSNR